MIRSLFALLLTSTTALAAPEACTIITRNFELDRATLGTPQLSALLFSAADNDCPDIVRPLIEAGGSLATRDRTGGTALHHAARAGRSGMIRVLLAQGADINQRDINGATPLSIAIETSHQAAARALIDAGADVTLPGHSGVTPLAAAAYKGSVDVLDTLLRRGADPKAPDSTGKPAILYAAARGFTQIVTRLLDAGSDVNQVYANGLTVLSWAAGYAEDVPASEGAGLVRLLLERGARVNTADDRGMTPLMIAASMDHAEVAELLLARGADASLKDKDGRSAADLAPSASLRQRLAAQSPAR